MLKKWMFCSFNLQNHRRVLIRFLWVAKIMKCYIIQFYFHASQHIWIIRKTFEIIFENETLFSYIKIVTFLHCITKKNNLFCLSVWPWHSASVRQDVYRGKHRKNNWINFINPIISWVFQSLCFILLLTQLKLFSSSSNWQTVHFMFNDKQYVNE